VCYASAFLLSIAFAALAILVAAGAFTGLDQWSVDHLMPGATFDNEESGLAAALIPLWGTHWGNGWSIAANVVTLPASFLVALAIVAWRSRVLAALLLAAVAVETLCKEVITRPELQHGARHVIPFDDSFPSGHTLRAVIVAGAVASPWATAWAVAAIVLLQLAGWHTPTDVAGGLLLGASALLARGGAARALRRRRLARSRAG
jgi:membrane-associated phospholipid phosphatase